MFARQALAALLCILLAVPALALPTGTGARPAALGSLTYGEGILISNSSALPGSTIFSGDTIEVGARGNAFIALMGGMQIRLAEQTRVRLAKVDSGVEIEMIKGRAFFRTSGQHPVIARLADATLRAKGETSAVGVVAVLSDTKAIFGAEKGEFLLSTAHDGRSVGLKAGEAVEVTLVPDPQAVPPGGTSNASSLSGKRAALVALITGAIATSVAVLLTQQGSGLTDTQKKNLVSPFRFP